MTAGAVGVRGMWKTTPALCCLTKRNKIIYIELVCHMVTPVQGLFPKRFESVGECNCLCFFSPKYCLLINIHKLFLSPSVLIYKSGHKTFISQTQSNSEGSAVLVLSTCTIGEKMSFHPLKKKQSYQWNFILPEHNENW